MRAEYLCHYEKHATLCRALDVLYSVLTRALTLTRTRVLVCFPVRCVACRRGGVQRRGLHCQEPRRAVTGGTFRFFKPMHADGRTRDVQSLARAHSVAKDRRSPHPPDFCVRSRVPWGLLLRLLSGFETTHALGSQRDRRV
jgi:hypothetical protein